MNSIIKIAALFGATAVALGAFGAHALKDMLLESSRLETFETAVDYHFYHALALLFIGILKNQIQNKYLDWSAYSMIAGITIFSGSLYILCLSGITILGAITPIGGVLLITGWVLLFMAKKSPAK